MKIYGHDINLTEAEEGEIITDVMVLARAVRHTDEGGLEDFILSSSTRTTTGMIQSGMLTFAMDSMMSSEDE